MVFSYCRILCWTSLKFRRLWDRISDSQRLNIVGRSLMTVRLFLDLSSTKRPRSPLLLLPQNGSSFEGDLKGRAIASSSSSSVPTHIRAPASPLFPLVLSASILTRKVHPAWHTGNCYTSHCFGIARCALWFLCTACPVVARGQTIEYQRISSYSASRASPEPSQHTGPFRIWRCTAFASGRSLWT